MAGLVAGQPAIRCVRKEFDVNRVVMGLVFLLSCVAVSGCAGGGGPDLLATNTTSEPASAQSNFNGGSRSALVTKASASKSLRVVKTLPPPPQTKGGKIQLVSKGDEMEVVFFGIEKLDREVRVSSTGSISMPLIGSMPAEGKTVRQLELDLERAYGKSYLQNPQITINVKKSLGQRVTVNGEVKQPGIYPVGPGATLMQALAQAKGFTALGDPGKVYVFRNVGGEKYVAHYNVEQIQNGRLRDPRVYGNDVVVTFSSTAKVAMQNLKDIMGIARSATSFALIP